LIGYGTRTTEAGFNYVADIFLKKGIASEIIGIKLPQYRINLDGAIMPVSSDIVVCHKESIDYVKCMAITKTQVRHILLSSYLVDKGYQILEVTQEESIREATNILNLGKRKVVSYLHNQRINAALEDMGVEVIPIEGDLLIKGMGGPRCMTRPILRDPE